MGWSGIWTGKLISRYLVSILNLANQALLGITTLIYIVPLPLAVTHQAGSVALVSTGLFMCNRLKHIIKAARRGFAKVCE